MGSLLIGARVLLLVVFATAGVAKLLDQSGTRNGLAGFGVPQRALAVGAVLLPLAELGTAVALVPPGSAQWGGVASLVLLLAFIAGIANAMRGGRAPDCHCFGQLHSAPAGRGTLIRNLALAAPAALVALEGPGPSMSAWVGDRTAAELVAIAAVLAAAVLGVLAVRFFRESRTLRRALDDAHARLNALPLGLPVGAVAPGFSLRRTHGEDVTLEALCARGRPVALIFVSPSCGSCQSVFAAAGRWQAALAGDLTVAIISDGEPAENLAIVKDSSADVLLQEDWEVAKAYRVPATPNALVVSPQRRIASALVSTEPAIEALIRLTVRQEATGQFNGASAAQPVA
jgi:hypothetical protein